MLTPGVQWGSYVVERRLGGGGMAEVYLVRHATLGSRHALKVLDPALASMDDVRERFLNEGRIQSHLRHPNLVGVTDLVSGSGGVGLVLEYVEGETLEDLLLRLRRPLEAPEVLAILVPVLQGVGAAHAHGVVHRDLKPANVMLQPAGGGVVPKVFDFGIARLAGERQRAHGLTQSGARMGTWHYMSPEQFRAARDVTPASDVFSLGVVAYELACGVLPFDGAGEYSIGEKIVNGIYTPPQVARPEISPVLAAAIVQALRPNPAERFQSCEAFAAALLGRGAGPIWQHGVRLLLETSQGSRLIELREPEVRLGASAENRVVVNAPGVSGRHARLLVHTDAVGLEDLGSTNGTWFNGQRLKPATPVALLPGSRFHLGRHVIVSVSPALGAALASLPPARPEGLPPMARPIWKW